MSTQLILYAAIMLVGVFISSVAQVMLKKAAQRNYDSLWQEYLNPLVMIAYMVFFGATLLSIYAYQVVPLSMGAILEATGYIYVAVFSATIFHEKIDGMRILALGMIVAGIVVYSVFG